MSRLADRRGEPIPSRVAWAENDLDMHDRDIGRLAIEVKDDLAGLRRENREQHAEVKKRIDGMQKIMLGILVTLIGLLGSLVLQLATR